MLNFEIPTWVGDNIIMLAIYITGKTLIAKYSEEENFYEQFTKKTTIIPFSEYSIVL